MTALTVLYDAQCALCRRCRRWLERQPSYLKLEFIPATSSEVDRRFPDLDRTEPLEELVVISDAGGVYRGPEAFIMCLYALEEYRELSIRLSRPAFRPMARAVFRQLSRSRGALSWWLEKTVARKDDCAGDKCMES